MPYLTKADERAAMEKIAAILLPLTVYTETYGVSAMYDQCHAWARAIDTDMPMECWQRDKAEADHQKKMAEERAALIVSSAEARAAGIVKAAELEAQRIHSAVDSRLAQARRDLDRI